MIINLKVKFDNSEPFFNDQLTTLEKAQLPKWSPIERAWPKDQYKAQEILGSEGNYKIILVL